MKIELAVMGQGAVSPAGIGVDALLHREPRSTLVSALGASRQPWPVLRVDPKEPALVGWQRHPRLRRASSITLFLVEATDQALAGLGASERAETGVIVAFSAGCLAYSRRFFEDIVKHGQRSASPALFPETVFNSPVSHVASVLGLNGAAYALVGDETAWVSALQTASVWLQQERVKRVLVLGVEEFDPLVLDAYRSARWLRRKNSPNGFLTSEGAAGILVQRAGPADTLIITNARNGLIYRTKEEAAAAAEGLLAGSDPALPCYPTSQRSWLASLEKKATESRATVPCANHAYLGEAFTASAAWHTVRALATLTSQLPALLLPVWGLNHQLALLELVKRR